MKEATRRFRALLATYGEEKILSWLDYVERRAQHWRSDEGKAQARTRYHKRVEKRKTEIEEMREKNELLEQRLAAFNRERLATSNAEEVDRGV